MTTIHRVTVGAWSRALGPHALALAVLTVLGPLGFVACAATAGHVAWWVWVAVAVAAFLLVEHVDRLVQTGFWLVLLVLWLVAVRGPTWWAVPAGACALIAHTTAALLAGLPDQARIGRVLAWRYAVRIALLVAASTVVASGVETARHQGLDGGAAYGGAGLALLAGLVWFWRSR